VHLTKNVIADRGLVAEMYREPLAELARLKATCDPRRLLRSQLMDRLLGDGA